jgi:hypothetical protein
LDESAQETQEGYRQGHRGTRGKSTGKVPGGRFYTHQQVAVSGYLPGESCAGGGTPGWPGRAALLKVLCAAAVGSREES